MHYDRFVRFRDKNTGTLLGVESSSVWDRQQQKAIDEHVNDPSTHKTQRQIEEMATDVASEVFDLKKGEIVVDLEQVKAAVREAQSQISALGESVSALSHTLNELSEAVPRLAERIGAEDAAGG